mmetsp:Transcript_2036/g.3761  ORF Transcript_2036/g.3761 Transcript_2036/m.3761 type:complete len:106 (+) Transcript_2036:47-364(+)
MTTPTLKLARRLSQLTDDNLNYDISSSSIDYHECRTLEAKKLKLPKECVTLIEKYEKSRKQTQNIDASYQGSHGGISARAKEAQKRGHQTHAQIQRRLTKSHNRR